MHIANHLSIIVVCRPATQSTAMPVGHLMSKLSGLKATTEIQQVRPTGAYRYKPAKSYCYCVMLLDLHKSSHIHCVEALRWGSRPRTPEFCVGENNMLISKNTKTCFTPDAKPKICITPDAKPKTQDTEL